MMNILFIASRPRGWTPFNYFRVTVHFLIGIGLGLVSLVTLNDAHTLNFAYTPWPLPTLCIILFFVLVFSHLPPPPPIFGRFSKHPNENPDNKWGWNVVSVMGFRQKPSAEPLVVEETKAFQPQAFAQRVSDEETGYQGASRP